MRGTLAIAASAISLVCCAAAWGATLHEAGAGTVALSPAGGATVTLTGTVAGSPVNGTLSGKLAIDTSTAVGSGGCPAGYTDAYSTTAKVTLKGPHGKLKKKETGKTCFRPTPIAPSDTRVVFVGTYTVNGATSTGKYAGASGTGKAKYVVDIVRTSQTFTSTENGTIKLKAKPKPGPKSK